MTKEVSGMNIEDDFSELFIPKKTRMPKRAIFIERLIAAVIDIILVSLLIKGVDWLSGNKLPPLFGADLTAYLIPLVITIGYFALYAFSRNGQTIAKGWLRIRVVDLQGRNLSWLRFVWREFLARGPIILLYGWLGSYSLLWYLTYLLALSKKRRALHDLLAGTQVIVVNQKRAV